MNITKQDLGKSQIELTVEMSPEEFDPYISKAAEKLARDIKIDGFRPGKAPLEMVKQKVGEITVLEEAANLVVNKTIGEVIEKNIGELEPIGRPDVRITKLAAGNPLEYKVTLTTLPAAELGEYKNFGFKAQEIKINDDDVNKVVDQLREMKVKEALVDRKASEGDKVMADIEMFLDKVPIEGGSGKGAFVIIGKPGVIPGLDKKLLGAKKGETREFSLPYPENFHQKNLAGKLVEFRVKINDIYERQLPAIDEELAKSFGSKTVDEMKENIRASLAKEKQDEAFGKLDAAILQKIIKSSKFGDIPDTLINEEAHAMMHEIEHQIEGQGGKFDDYLSSIKKSKDEYMLGLAPEAVRRIKAGLALREIIKKEKIAVIMSEVEARREELLRQYKGYEKVEERLKSPDYLKQLHSLMINQRVTEKLREWNEKKDDGKTN